MFFLFAVVWLTDVVAYFVGRFVGGPKLWPSVSPNKTWSGAVGGLAGAVFAGFSRRLVCCVVSFRRSGAGCGIIESHPRLAICFEVPLKTSVRR